MDDLLQRGVCAATRGGGGGARAGGQHLLGVERGAGGVARALQGSPYLLIPGAVLGLLVQIYY